jgi:hypothetical protein
MTAITLTAGFDPALAIASPPLSVEQMDDHALLAATREGDETAFRSWCGAIATR